MKRRFIRRAVAIFCGITLLVTVSLLADENLKKKAIRREMVEMDVATRNIASILSLRAQSKLDDSLQRLASWQMKTHPELGKPFASVLTSWEKKGVLVFGQALQKEVAGLRRFAGQRKKLDEKDWDKVNQSFVKIIKNCQGCHQALKKDTL